MGSYAECWLGTFYVGSTKEYVHPGLIGLFRSGDKQIVRDKKQSMPFPMRHWLRHIECDEDVSSVFYRAPIQIVRERLELKGYSLEVAKSAFKLSCRHRAQECEDREYYNSSAKKHFTERAERLRSLKPDEWIKTLRDIRIRNLEKPGHELMIENKSMFDIYESDWYGYEGPDLNVPLRLALEVCDNGDEFIY